MVDWTQEESRGDVDRDDAHRDVIIAKHANKVFWSKVTVRTKKADNLVRQSQHAVRHWVNNAAGAIPGDGVQRGLFGWHADMWHDDERGHLPMALRGWKRPTGRSPPTSRTSQRLVMVGNELRSNFWLVPFVD